MGPRSDCFLVFHRVPIFRHWYLHLNFTYFVLFRAKHIKCKQSMILANFFFLASFTANFNVNFWVAWNSYWASSLGFLGPNTTAGTHPNEFVIWWLHCPHRISEGVCVSSSPHLHSSICYSSLPTLSSSTRFCLVSLKNYIHGNISSPFFCLRWLPISSLVTSHTFVWEICREFQINSISRGRKGP